MDRWESQGDSNALCESSSTTMSSTLVISSVIQVRPQTAGEVAAIRVDHSRDFQELRTCNHGGGCVALYGSEFDETNTRHHESKQKNIGNNCTF